MLHPTMLDDVGPTCWLRLNRRNIRRSDLISGRAETSSSKDCYGFARNLVLDFKFLATEKDAWIFCINKKENAKRNAIL